MTKHVDDFLWRWLELRESLESPAGADLVADTGLIFDTCCRKCSRPNTCEQFERRVRGSEKTVTSYRCSVCQAPWPVEIAFLLRNEFSKTPHPPGIERQLVELATYSRLFSRLSMREVRAYLILFLFDGIRDYRELAEAIRERWPTMRPMNGSRAVGDWTEWTARKTVSSARHKLRDGAARAGLWEYA